jgi:hypothetical protein
VRGIERKCVCVSALCEDDAMNMDYSVPQARQLAAQTVAYKVLARGQTVPQPYLAQAMVCVGVPSVRPGARVPNVYRHCRVELPRRRTLPRMQRSPAKRRLYVLGRVPGLCPRLDWVFTSSAPFPCVQAGIDPYEAIAERDAHAARLMAARRVQLENTPRTIPAEVCIASGRRGSPTPARHCPSPSHPPARGAPGAHKAAGRAAVAEPPRHPIASMPWTKPCSIMHGALHAYST